jgi:hypothetical protein
MSAGASAGALTLLGCASLRSISAALLTLCILLPACAEKPRGPEAQLRATVAAAERAAEAKNLGAVKALISQRYADDRGQDRKAIEGILTLTFLRNQTIYLLTRVDSIELPEPKRAQLRVFVAMAGGPLSGAADLLRMRANLYRFDLDLEEEEEGDWKLTSADWRPAKPEDFL